MDIKLTEAEKIKCLNSDDVFEIMQRVLCRENKIDQDKQHFWIIGLAINNKALFIELVSFGSIKANVVEPINVFRVAILKNAVKVILVHNHPSEELTASEEDKDITDRLIQVGRIIEVEVIDHLIITVKSFVSFVNIGLFEQLKKSLKWVPPYKIIEMIKKEERAIRKQAIEVALETGEEIGKEKGLKEGEEIGVKKGKEEGLKEGKEEMACAMKQKGISLQTIKEVSGLSIKEIEKL